MKALSDTEIRSLVSLLDEKDPGNLDLVQRQILDLGAPAIPYLDELRGRSEPDLTARVDELARQLHFRGLQEAFRELAASPTPDLEQGVWLVARFGYPDADPAVYGGWLDSLADQVRRELPPDAPPAQALQQLNSRLFDAMGFCGNEKRYYDPDNSYLNRVIENRRGIPVSLSVLYLLVARRLGLPVYGVATPGHFLLGLRLGPKTSYLDAYNRGRVMTLAEVQQMLARSGYEFRPEFVAPASSRDILARMMRNLVSIYQKAAQADRAEEISSLVDILLAGRSARPAARES
jgi:regulator of sirC expression with transglutaminase-like and TPR domain